MKTGIVYRYELHCHTSEGSKCSVFPAEEMADFYHHMGYSGICITDHFSGNGSAPDGIAWNERVEHFYNIYLKTKKAGEKLGLSVFFGLEYSLVPDANHMSRVCGNDFLLLNVAKEWLIGNRTAFCGPPAKLFEKIREAGGFVVHAHPFLEAAWVESIRLYPKNVGAVEVFNACCTDFINANAGVYAKTYELIEVAGSDCHNPDQQIFTGVETENPCLTSAELVAAIQERRTRIFTISRNKKLYDFQ